MGDGLDESLEEYRARWYRSLPVKASPWEDVKIVSQEVLPCTCPTFVLMQAGCCCGTMRQERMRNVQL